MFEVIKGLKTIQDAAVIACRIQAAKHDVKVVYGARVATACTDGNTIYIPPLDYTDAITEDILLGYVDHETAHVAETDFSVSSTIQGPVRNFYQCIEDLRIEHVRAKRYPGVPERIDRLIAGLIQTGEMCDPLKIDDPMGLVQQWLAFQGRAEMLGYRRTAAYGASLDQAMESKLQGLADILRPLRMKVLTAGGTADSKLIAENVMQAILDWSKEKQQPPEASDDTSQEESQQPDQTPESDPNDGSDANENESDNQPNDQNPSGDGDQADQDGQGDQPQASDAQDGDQDSAPSDGQDTGQNEAPASDTDDGTSNGNNNPSGEGDADGQSPQPSSNANANPSNAPGAGPTQADAQQAAETLEGQCSGTLRAAESADLGDLAAKALKCDATAAREQSPFLPLEESVSLPTNESVDTDSANANSILLKARLAMLLQSTRYEPSQLHRNGSRIDNAAIHRVSLGDPRIFVRRDDVKARNTHVHIVVDSSGSMGASVGSSNRIALAMQAAYVAASAVKSIPKTTVAVTSFPGYNGHEVNFVVEPKQLIDKSRFNIHSGYGTPLSAALMTIAPHVVMQPEQRKIVIVLTDGDPDDRNSAIEVVKLFTRSGIEMVGIGIDCDAVIGLFPASEVINDVSQLTNALMATLTHKLLNAA